MAANTTGMRVEGTMVVGTGTTHDRGGRRWVGAAGLVAAALIGVLIFGATLHDRRAIHPAAPAVPHVMSQAQRRLLENNTTNLPNAVDADDSPVVDSTRQKFLDVNAAWLPVSTDAASPALLSSQRRLLEVNTTMLAQDDAAAMPYAESVTPAIGHPR